MASIEIRGLDQLQRRLSAIRAAEVLRRPMVRATARVQAHIGSYARSAGRPTASYVRGRGPVNRRGQVTRLTSKHLGKRWTSEVKVSGGDVLGVVGNDVSYGPFVQSAEHQAWHHGLRGWKTDEQVLEEEAAWVQREFAGAIRTALGD